MRYFVSFAYNGQKFHGWQKQPNAITVQETMEKAFSTLLGAHIDLVAAGRTDAGVHARAMMAHYDFDGNFETKDLVHRLNSFLEQGIVIKEIRLVPQDSHARFDAVERSYEYWMLKEKDPFLYHAAYRVPWPVDLDVMNKAAEILLEYQDFECFSRTRTDVKTFFCDIKEAYWSERGNLQVFTITADRFLRNMVRAIVGTLLEIGWGRKDQQWLREVILSKDRQLAGRSVPAKGLYLNRVVYPDFIWKTYGQGK